MRGGGGGGGGGSKGSASPMWQTHAQCAHVHRGLCTGLYPLPSSLYFHCDLLVRGESESLTHTFSASPTPRGWLWVVCFGLWVVGYGLWAVVAVPCLPGPGRSGRAIVLHRAHGARARRGRGPDHPLRRLPLRPPPDQRRLGSRVLAAGTYLPDNLPTATATHHPLDTHTQAMLVRVQSLNRSNVAGASTDDALTPRASTLHASSVQPTAA